MKDATLKSAKLKQGSGERGRDGKAQQSMIASESADALPPVFERSPPLIRTAGLLRQDHALLEAVTNDLVRQHESTLVSNLDPAGAVRDCRPLVRVDRREIFSEQPPRRHRTLRPCRVAD